MKKKKKSIMDGFVDFGSSMNRSSLVRKLLPGSSMNRSSLVRKLLPGSSMNRSSLVRKLLPERQYRLDQGIL